MAISNKIFDAPIGRISNPSDQIRETMSSIGDGVAKMMTNESDRLRQEQTNFSEMYANLGEMDSELQENYAGIMQEAVTSTRDWIKDQYKSGVNSNDPEFAQGLSQRIGRIKAGMGNADMRREELKTGADFIKDNQNIPDKNEALKYMYGMANNPDFLISKNSTSLIDHVVENFESPLAIMQNYGKAVPSDGTDNIQFTGKDGSLKNREIVYNRYIRRDNPLLEDGSPNIQVSMEDVKELMSGSLGQGLLRYVSKVKEERYPNDPTDIGYQKAMKDALRLSFGNNVKTSTIRSAYDINQDQIKNQADQQRLNISASREERYANKNSGETEETTDDRYSKFKSDYDSGRGVILSDFETPGGNLRNIEWVKNPAIKDMSSLENWKSLTDEKKKEYMEGLEVPIDSAPNKDWKGINPLTWGNPWKKDLESEEVYNIVKSKFAEQENVPDITGIKYQVKGGNDDGSTIWEDDGMDIDTSENDDDLIKIYKQLENTRVSGQSKSPVSPVTEPLEKASDRINKLP